MKSISRDFMQLIKRFNRQNFAAQVIEGMGVGFILGQLLPDQATTYLSPVGNGFIRLFQMPVLPFISLSLIAGVGRLEMHQAGRLLIRAGAVLVFFWALILLTVCLIPLGFPDWQQGSFYQPSLLETGESFDLVELFIPSNPFEAFAQTQIPAIVLFSLMLGIALIRIPKRKSLIKIFDTLCSGLLKISTTISKFTPLGVLAIVASSANKIGSSQIPRIGIYVALQAGIALLLTFLILPLIVQGLTPFKAKKIINRFKNPMLIAFATANMLVVLPSIINIIKQLILEEKRKVHHISTHNQSANSALIKEIELPIELLTPLALVFPGMGRIASIAFIPFSEWMTGRPLIIEAYPEFLLTGLASTFMEGVMAMTFMINRLNLSNQLVDLYVTLDQTIIARLGTLLECSSVFSLVIISTWISLGNTHEQQQRLLPAAISYLSIPLFIATINAIFNRVPAPVNWEKEQMLSQGFAVAKGTAKIDLSHTKISEPGSWQRIKKQGIIHYCIMRNDYPMSYKNSSGNLVGLDIEIGLLFAEEMGLKPEFKLFKSFNKPIGKSTKLSKNFFASHNCDMTLSNVITSHKVISKFLSTRSLRDLSLSFLSKQPQFSTIKQWNDLKKYKTLRIGILEGKNLVDSTLSQAAPEAIFIRQRTNRLLIEALNNNQVDLVLMTTEKASAWTVLEPSLRITVPMPVQQVPKQRILPLEAKTLLRIWDDWMFFQYTTGATEKIFDHWVKGIPVQSLNESTRGQSNLSTQP
ncbi:MULTISPECIES: cation:dicarboxylate symporter family transporter [unclassified Synechococcus]|nr:cation:dicarboxylase symporter family transporter [Synechococcus sp. MIT S9509]